jgi:hypothetical protein
VRGIGYQDLRESFNGTTSLIDSLEDGARCARDIPYFLELGINTLRIPFLRPEASHSSCMKQLRDAGIYVLVSIDAAPDDADIWGYVEQHPRTELLNSLARYSNLLGVWISSPEWDLSPYAKAVIRDLKEHLRTSRLRAIPIGYYGFSPLEFSVSNIASCGGQDVSADFLFYVMHSPCTGAGLTQNVRADLDQLLSNQPPLPVLVNGNQCDVAIQAEYKSLLLVYSSNYTEVHSGAVWFRYFDNISTNSSGL